jgi:hypothetical protein
LISRFLQDITVVGTLPDGSPLTFKHPAVQSACMFFGESLCLIPYFYMRWRKRKAKRRNPAYVPMDPGDAPPYSWQPQQQLPPNPVHAAG